MEGFSHTLKVTYRDHKGMRRESEKGFNSYDEAKAAIEGVIDVLEGLDCSKIMCSIVGENPYQIKQEQATNEPTHYRIVAKDSFGTYVTSLLPISEDLQAALDNMDEDLKLIDVYKVTMPFKSAYPNPKAYGRLAIRTI